MDVIYHKSIKQDLRAALSYYDAEGGKRLGDKFFAEVEATIERVLKNPQAFSFTANNLRRVALISFPYHFLYEESESCLNFLVFRHDKRHPHYGLKRRAPRA
jgi:hypothetical protein